MKTLEKLLLVNEAITPLVTMLTMLTLKIITKLLQIEVSKKHQMLILEQFNKLVLQQIQIEQKTQGSILFLKRQKKLF